MKFGQLLPFCKILFLYAFVTVFSFMFISCDSSTESENIETFQSKIIFKKYSEVYSLDSDGNVSLLTDNVYTGTKYEWFSYNTILGKKAFYDQSENKVIISDYSNSNKIYADLPGLNHSGAILQWMPDNQHILCNYSGALCKFNLDGKIVKGFTWDTISIATGGERLNNISFSADGKYFIYGSQKGIIVSDENGARTHIYPQITVWPRQIKIYPKLFPTGDKAAYLNIRDKENSGSFVSVDLVDLKTNIITQISPDSLYADLFDISPDGKFIAFTTMTDNVSGDIYLYNTQNNSLKHLVTSGGHIEYFCFHPEENKIIYNMNNMIMASDIDGHIIGDISQDGTLMGVSKFKK